MTDMGFKAVHVAGLLDGSKPFTLRRAWRNGRTPDLDAKLRLVTGTRTPARRVFATAIVAFRCTVTFDFKGLTLFESWRVLPIYEGDALAVSITLAVATAVYRSAEGRESAAIAAGEFAKLDGFASYAEFWRFHSAHRCGDADPFIMRELIGLAAITPEFDHA